MLDRLPGNVGAAIERVETVVGTTTSLVDRTFDLICSQLVFMFVADPADELVRLRGFAAPGATLCLAVLGDKDDIIPFSAYWRAAASVIPGLAAPNQYVHTRFGDPSDLATGISAAGWSTPTLRTVECWRELDANELWTWVSGALPIHRADGTEPDTFEPAVHEAIRGQLISDVAPFAIAADRYRLPVHGTLLRATAT